MMIEKKRRGSKKLLFSTHLFWLVRGETRARVEHEGRRKLQALALKCIHRKCNTELHNYYSTAAASCAPSRFFFLHRRSHVAIQTFSKGYFPDLLDILYLALDFSALLTPLSAEVALAATAT